MVTDNGFLAVARSLCNRCYGLMTVPSLRRVVPHE
jgi:hypothetical protein